MAGQSAAVLPNPESLKGKKVAIIASRWHDEIVARLIEGAKTALISGGLGASDILVQRVPGAHEIALGCQWAFESRQYDGVVALGCVVKGETAHFDVLAQETSQQLSLLQLRANRPIGFGILLVENNHQAEERTGGNLGNKGEEAANAVLEMMALKIAMKSPEGKSNVGFGFGRKADQD